MNKFLSLIKNHIWIFIAIASVFLDQFSKFIVSATISYGDSIVVIPGFFSLTHTRNPGAAFGILSQQRWVFMVFTTIIIIAALVVLVMRIIKNPWGTISLAMVLGGGIGNMIDRIFIGEVVDFFAFNFWGYEFAVFNVADVFVCCGVFILVFYIIFTHDFDAPKEEGIDGKA